MLSAPSCSSYHDLLRRLFGSCVLVGSYSPGRFSLSRFGFLLIDTPFFGLPSLSLAGQTLGSMHVRWMVTDVEQVVGMDVLRLQC